VAGGLPLPVAAEDDLSELRRLAAADSLELKAAASAAANAATAFELSSRYPFLDSLEAGVSYERDTDHSRLLGPSASIELPLFNRGQGRILRAEAALEQRQATFASLAIAVDNAVALAHSEVFAARERVDIYTRRFIPAHQDNVARMHELQRVVALNPLELLRAKNAEFDAYADYVAALRDYAQARVALCRAVGSALPSESTAQVTQLSVPLLVTAAPAQGAGGDGAHDRKESVDGQD
jgi:cobalt-zinc-cadmium efflux system outer membrane protein